MSKENVTWLLQIQKLAGKLSKSEEMALKHKSELLNERIEEQKFKLRQGGVQALKGLYLFDRYFYNILLSYS